MTREYPLERRLNNIVAPALVVAIFIAGVLAIRQWTLGDEAGSLALVTIAATLTLALAAILALRQNVTLIDAAIEEAKAATQQAKASNETVMEMERQRELAYRPWLVYAGRRVDPGGSTGSITVMPTERLVVKNIGTGPALDVCLAAVRTTREGARAFQAHTIGGIAAGDEWDVHSLYLESANATGPRPDRYRCLVDDLAIDEVGEVVAVRYEDWFGNHYRSPGSQTDAKPVVWVGDRTLKDAPDWLRCS